MEKHADHTEDLSEFERRLASWAPAADGLNIEAMLFAAGRASARPDPTRLWPTLAVCSTVLAVALGIWLAAERNDRQNLARQ